jgi:hypothetical protein
MFETKDNITKEANFTTCLGSGHEPCQQAILELLGERLSRMQHHIDIQYSILCIRYSTSI